MKNRRRGDLPKGEHQPRIIAARVKDTPLPSKEEDEKGALGCVLLASETDPKQMQAEECLSLLRPNYFYNLPCRTIYEAMCKMRMGEVKHVITVPMLCQYLKKEKKLDEVGGPGFIANLPDAGVTYFHFEGYLKSLIAEHRRRWTITKGNELVTLANSGEVKIEELRERMGEIYEAANKDSGNKLIEIITPEQARAYEPDPADFLVGEGLISQDSFVTIGGAGGAGKSRLLTTLAVSGAKGKGTWQGYAVRSQFRTLILQTENKGTRLKEDFLSVPKQYDDFIRVSNNLPNGMAFLNADFRRELTRIHEAWPFQVLGLDPWNDICSEEGQSEYKEALRKIQECFRGRKMPCVVIVAHLRKDRGDSNGARKTGRQLMHELSGSLALSSTSRTVFAVTPASHQMDETRIVFEVAKANDCKPEWLKEHGTRTAWHRANGAFEPCADFDWEQWDNPTTANEGRSKGNLHELREAFGVNKHLEKKVLADRLSKISGMGNSTAYRHISPKGSLWKFLDVDKRGYLSLKEEDEE